MPAKNLARTHTEGIFLHVYNRGVAGRAIFEDEQDYQTFRAFLEEYLSPPAAKKTTFKIRGRTFTGVPHQSKNYHHKIALIAYRLDPTHFHLLVHQQTFGSVEKFMQSVCTRYAIYFHKKYKSSGYLFAGPYKSATVSNRQDLLYLTHYFHGQSLGRAHSHYSSAQEYLGVRKTPWVKPEVIWSVCVQKTQIPYAQYRKFIKNHALTEVDEHCNHSAQFNHLGRSPPRIRGKPSIPNALLRFRVPEFVSGIIVFFIPVFAAVTGSYL